MTQGQTLLIFLYKKVALKAKKAPIIKLKNESIQ